MQIGPCFNAPHYPGGKLVMKFVYNSYNAVTGSWFNTTKPISGKGGEIKAR